MPLPRFRIRTLMIAVVCAGVGIAIARTTPVKGYVSGRIGWTGPIMDETPIIDILASGAIWAACAYCVIDGIATAFRFIRNSRR